jgi:hypothetical protein
MPKESAAWLLIIFLTNLFYGTNAVLDKVLSGLMNRYKERVPDVSAIINAMIKESVIKVANEIENDHNCISNNGSAVFRDSITGKNFSALWF